MDNWPFAVAASTREKSAPLSLGRDNSLLHKNREFVFVTCDTRAGAGSK